MCLLVPRRRVIRVDVYRYADTTISHSPDPVQPYVDVLESTDCACVLHEDFSGGVVYEETKGHLDAWDSEFVHEVVNVDELLNAGACRVDLRLGR